MALLLDHILYLDPNVLNDMNRMREQCVEKTLQRKQQRLGHGGASPNTTYVTLNGLDLDTGGEQQFVKAKLKIDSDSDVVSQSINETEEYQAAGIHWADPVPHDACTSYGKREYQRCTCNTLYQELMHYLTKLGEYSARLWGLPPFRNWEKACHSTPNVIHDQIFETPYSCENRVRAFSALPQVIERGLDLVENRVFTECMAIGLSRVRWLASLTGIF